MAKPRILIISSATSIGGGELYLSHLLPRLTEQYDVTVLAPKAVRMLVGDSVQTKKFVPFPKFLEKTLSRTYRIKKLYYKVFFRMFNLSNFELINPQWYDEALLETLKPRPIVFTLHTNFNIDRNQDRAVQEHFRGIRKVICVSETAKSELVARGVSKEQCVVIPNGVDLDYFPFNKKPGNYITWVGRIEKADKNPQLFITIAEYSKSHGSPYQFRMVGEGSYQRELEDYAQKHGLDNLEFYGPAFPENMPNIYREASLLCVTSISEGMPLSILEAMASGVPVVAARVGGIPEMITSGQDGVLVNDHSDKDFFLAIENLLKSPSLHASITKSARKRVETTFNLLRVAEQVIQTYNEALDPGKENA